MLFHCFNLVTGLWNVSCLKFDCLWQLCSEGFNQQICFSKKKNNNPNPKPSEERRFSPPHCIYWHRSIFHWVHSACWNQHSADVTVLRGRHSCLGHWWLGVLQYLHNTCKVMKRMFQKQNWLLKSTNVWEKKEEWIELEPRVISAGKLCKDQNEQTIRLNL